VVIAVGSIVYLERAGVDDPVGAVSARGAAGVWGLLAVPLSNEDATLGGQLAGIAAIGGFAFAASGLVWLALKRPAGIRVDQGAEDEGIDLAECGLQAYPEFVAALPQGVAEGAPAASARPCAANRPCPGLPRRPVRTGTGDRQPWPA